MTRAHPSRFAVLLAASAALALSACGSDNPPRRFPTVPVDNVLETASHPAFRTMDHDSFKHAVVRYPADGGSHTVPVGDYLATRIAEAFPRNAEVDYLRLHQYDVDCASEGWMSSSVVCAVVGDFGFRLYRHPERIGFRLDGIELGSELEVEEGGFKVPEPLSGESDPLANQIRALIDHSAAEFRRKLHPLLLESNQRQVF